MQVRPRAHLSRSYARAIADGWRTHTHTGIPEELIEKKVGDATVDVHSVVKHNWQYLIDRNFVPYARPSTHPLTLVICGRD